MKTFINEQCKNCLYFFEGDMQVDLKKVGICRHSPPQMAAVPTPQNMMMLCIDVNFEGDRAACGQFMHKEDVVEYHPDDDIEM